MNQINPSRFRWDKVVISEEKQKLMVENANRNELKKRMADMRVFLKEQLISITE